MIAALISIFISFYNYLGKIAGYPTYFCVSLLWHPICEIHKKAVLCIHEQSTCLFKKKVYCLTHAPWHISETHRYSKATSCHLLLLLSIFMSIILEFMFYNDISKIWTQEHTMLPFTKMCLCLEAIWWLWQ